MKDVFIVGEDEATRAVIERLIKRLCSAVEYSQTSAGKRVNGEGKH